MARRGGRGGARGLVPGGAALGAGGMDAPAGGAPPVSDALHLLLVPRGLALDPAPGCRSGGSCAGPCGGPAGGWPPTPSRGPPVCRDLCGCERRPRRHTAGADRSAVLAACVATGAVVGAIHGALLVALLRDRMPAPGRAPDRSSAPVGGTAVAAARHVGRIFANPSVRSQVGRTCYPAGGAIWSSEHARHATRVSARVGAGVAVHAGR